MILCGHGLTLHKHACSVDSMSVIVPLEHPSWRRLARPRVHAMPRASAHFPQPCACLFGEPRSFSCFQPQISSDESGAARGPKMWAALRKRSRSFWLDWFQRLELLLCWTVCVCGGGGVRICSANGKILAPSAFHTHWLFRFHFVFFA